MKTIKKLSLALATALFALPLTAFAQDEAAAEEEASIYSWNAAIATTTSSAAFPRPTKRPPCSWAPT